MRGSIVRMLFPVLCALSASACSGAVTSGAMPALHPAAAFAAVNAAAVTRTRTTSSMVSSPQDDPLPTAAPTSAAATPFPIVSSLYTGRTPFHETAAALMAEGATVDAPTIAANYWSQGIGNNQPFGESGGGSPLYVAHAGDPGYVFACPEYGGCSAAGMVVHYPIGAKPAEGSDHHLVSIDPVYLHGEVDAWGGYGCTGQMSTVEPSGTCLHPCNLSSGSSNAANCSYGGFTPFSGSGLGNAGNAAGYAYGLFQVTAQELLNGQINHALGIVQSCLDDHGVFPAGRQGSDSSCVSTGNALPSASYGEMIHLKSSVDVASLGYSPYCQTIVQALQTYGAYTTDNNGGYGIAIEIEDIHNPQYAGNNPWKRTIFPSIAAGGDGTGSGKSFTFQSCLQRIPASDIEVLDVPNDTTT